MILMCVKCNKCGDILFSKDMDTEVTCSCENITALGGQVSYGVRFKTPNSYTFLPIARAETMKKLLRKYPNGILRRNLEGM